MNKRLMAGMRKLAGAVLVTTLIVLGGSFTHTARAASLHDSGAPGTPTPGTIRPDCSGSFTLSPSSQTINLGSPVDIHIHWSCQNFINVGFNIGYGDGASDQTQSCFSFCTVGDFDWTGHVYARRGTYSVNVSPSPGTTAAGAPQTVQVAAGAPQTVQVKVQ